MEQRTLARAGLPVSVVGMGTWQLGADWGDVSEATAREVLETSAAEGVTFFDTADVYGDGRSEQLIGRFLAHHRDDGFTVATKMGRRAEQVPENYVPANFRAWVDRSRRNLGVDRLQLVQLHCPPSEVIDSDATYDALDALVADGSIASYGVSVETAAQALSAIARPRVASVQIILNAFRLKPLDEVLPAASEAGVGIIARVPLASGLLSGRYDASTTFAPTTTAPTTATAARSTWARPSPGSTTRPASPRPRSSPSCAPPTARPACRRPRRRSPGRGSCRA